MLYKPARRIGKTIVSAGLLAELRAGDRGHEMEQKMKHAVPGMTQTAKRPSSKRKKGAFITEDKAAQEGASRRSVPSRESKAMQG